MSASVPVYPRPCLASDEDNNAIYLLGVSTTGIGKLESSYVSLANVDSPFIKPLGSQVDINSWATNAPKACFTYPSDVHPNSPIMLVQYGPFKNFMTIMNAGGEFTLATPVIGVIPTSTPLLAVGTYGSTPTTAWSGNNVVFDTQGGGYIYPSMGAVDQVSHVITQSAGKSVAMS
ncbi:hypothetical protein BGZ97_008107, partial [Linnemannia gamsii]